MLRYMYLSIRYAIYYGSPTIVMMLIFFIVAFTGTIVLQNERIPPEYKKMRLSKATSSLQHRHEEVGKRNKRYM